MNEKYPPATLIFPLGGTVRRRGYHGTAVSIMVRSARINCINREQNEFHCRFYSLRNFIIIKSMFLKLRHPEKHRIASDGLLYFAVTQQAVQRIWVGIQTSALGPYRVLMEFITNLKDRTSLLEGKILLNYRWRYFYKIMRY